MWWSPRVEAHQRGCPYCHDARIAWSREACVLLHSSASPLRRVSLPDTDLITMFEEAFKLQPTNEDLGVQTFFANVRANNWKAAHQVRVYSMTLEFILMRWFEIATRMYKQLQDDRYLYWSIISAVLQVCAASPCLFLPKHALLGQGCDNSGKDAPHLVRIGS